MDYRRTLAWAAIIAVCASCGGGEAESGSAADLPRYSADGLLISHSDVDGDGVPDVLKYYREVDVDGDEGGEPELELVRTEIDLNADGLVNMRRTYDEAGELVLEEMDGNLDGRMDHSVFWENGSAVRSESDEDYDGRLDTYREYRDGVLTQVVRDTDGDGVMDTWSYYDARGLDRVGYDTNGDGEADRWSHRE